MSNSIKGVILALSILLVLTSAIIFLVKNPDNSSSTVQPNDETVQSTKVYLAEKTADEVYFDSSSASFLIAPNYNFSSDIIAFSINLFQF